MSYNNHELRDALKKAKRKLAEQQEMIEELLAPPYKIGTFVQMTTENNAVILFDGSFAEITMTGISLRERKNIKFGDLLRITEEGNAVSVLEGLALNMGAIVAVKEVGQGWVEIDDSEGPRRVMTDRVFEVEPGARVVLDSTGFLAKENLGKVDNNYTREATSTSWDDIGGLWDAKNQLREAIELPLSHPEIFEMYGQDPIKGVLLYGPPGCGKTLLGKATATSIAQSFGAQSSTGFIYIKGPEVLSKWVGESEAKIRQLFAMARDHKKDTGYPAVIFIDEADALLGRRGGRVGGSSISDTIVPSFLAEMDGLDDTGAVVLLATNMPNTLDPAVIRPGRIDRKIKISRPDRDTSADILRIHLRNKPLVNTIEAVIGYVMDAVFDPKNLVQGQPLFSVLNGAILENIVSRATSFAIKDDIARGEFGGITKQHFMDAIQLVSLQDEDVDISNF